MRGDILALNKACAFPPRHLGEPVVDDVVQVCIMSFSAMLAKIVMPLGQMSESVVPILSAASGTNYGAAFRLLARTIEHDSATLKRLGYMIYRPCAFFLVDGAPTDRDWQQTFTSTFHS